MKNIIMVIIIDKRSTAAPTVQEILTQHGNIIHFRLGFHDLSQGEHGENGQIILQLKGATEEIHQLTDSLSALDLVTVKAMSLD